MNDYNPSKCIPKVLKSITDISKINKTFTFCNKTSRKDALETNWIDLTNLTNICQKSCKTIQFKGDKNTYESLDYLKGILLVTYFSTNEINVQEEYLLYDIVDVVGIVGGNLGLFIGFSFSGFITKIFSMVNDHVLNKMSM